MLLRDETPRDIWDQHVQILDAICRQDAELAESLVRLHITQASGFMVARMRGDLAGSVA